MGLRETYTANRYSVEYKGITLPGCTGCWARPNEARLQLARLPSITGVGSSHAFLADSASRNVTCGRRESKKTNTSSQLIQRAHTHTREAKKKNSEKEVKSRGTDESVSLGAARVAVGDDDGLEYVPETLVEAPEPAAVGLPGETAHENLGVGGVPEGRGRGGKVQPRARARRRRRPGRRPRVLLLRSHRKRIGSFWRRGFGGNLRSLRPRLLAGRERI
jgi:hypothetical protein